MEFSRQEYWSGLLFPSPGDLPNPGIKPRFPALQADSLLSEPPGKLHQFSSVAQSCPTLCDPMNHGTPGLPVHHQLLEFTQTHVHQVGDAIQPSHPLAFMIPHSKWSISVNYWFLPVSFSMVRAKHLYSIYFVAGAVQRNLPLFTQSSLQPFQEPLLLSHLRKLS